MIGPINIFFAYLWRSTYETKKKYLQFRKKKIIQSSRMKLATAYIFVMNNCKRRENKIMLYPNAVQLLSLSIAWVVQLFLCAPAVCYYWPLVLSPIYANPVHRPICHLACNIWIGDQKQKTN